MSPKKEQKLKIIRILLAKLKEEGALWSYDNRFVNETTISDDNLIALTLRYLDLPEISLLFKVYPFAKVKTAWKLLLVPEGEYLYTLNRFLAWFCFGVKRPDAYLKCLQTRRINSLS